ncbi:hypothetical protein B0H16DRAFT_1239275, partial [Mycena metata]
LPLWYHTGEDPGKTQYHNTAACICLRENHGVIHVHEGMEVLSRLQDSTHKKSKHCRCVACNGDRRSRGCENPHACTTAVEKTLSRLLPKWDPRGGAKEATPEPPTTPGNSFRHPPQITSLADGFRVLTRTPQYVDHVVQPRPQQRNPPSQFQKIVFVGSMTSRDTEGKQVAGGGIWYGPEHIGNMALRVTENSPQTSQRAEI